MRRFMSFKSLGLALTMVVLVATIAMAVSATGAYFSDTKPGTVSGTIGTIKVTTTGGVDNAGTSFVWNNMLPGEVYAAEIGYQNTGASVQDVYLTFPNATALSALNSLGTYGAVKVWANGSVIYYNNNLNDFANNGTSGLPAVLKIASNVGPTASGTIKFEFQYASKMSSNEPGGVFNYYPVPLTGTQDPRNAAGFGQKTVITGQVGNGLPFAVVATQPGKVPGETGASAGF